MVRCPLLIAATGRQPHETNYTNYFQPDTPTHTRTRTRRVLSQKLAESGLRRLAILLHITHRAPILFLSIGPSLTNLHAEFSGVTHQVILLHRVDVLPHIDIMGLGV